MKRVFLVFMSLMLIMCLVGCDNVKDGYKENLFEEINNKINTKIESNKYYYNIDTIDCVIKDLVNNEIGEIEVEIMSEKIFSDVSNLFLDLDFLEKIKSGFEKQFGYKFYYDDFYGNYDETYFFFTEGDDQWEKDIIISDVIFRYNCDWDIYVCYQDKFYFIDEAFDIGIVEQETLEKVAQIHYLKTIHKYNDFELQDRKDYFDLSSVR